jgi:hypothetical protein
VDDALGLAQALIHETAHQKLDALGVHADKAGRLIVNDAADSCLHPHFNGRRQPMTAAFHEQYSFIHVVALDLYVLAAADDARERQRILMLLARNTARMEAGHDEIAGHIRTDRDGAWFVEAFLKWSSNLLARARAELDANGYGFAPIQTQAHLD